MNLLEFLDVGRFLLLLIIFIIIIGLMVVFILIIIILLVVIIIIMPVSHGAVGVAQNFFLCEYILASYSPLQQSSPCSYSCS